MLVEFSHYLLHPPIHRVTHSATVFLQLLLKLLDSLVEKLAFYFEGDLVVDLVLIIEYFLIFSIKIVDDKLVDVFELVFLFLEFGNFPEQILILYFN